MQSGFTASEIVKQYILWQLLRKTVPDEHGKEKGMKKSERQEREQVSRLLGRNPLPEVDSRKRDALVSRLALDACDMDYMGEDSFMGKLAMQISYLSPWDFLLEAGLLAAVFYFAFQGRLSVVLLLEMFLAPLMIGILLYELSKTFSHNMWEMESACRYNLPQLFFLRLCILSGGDLIVLAASLAALRMTGGMLWQFSLCVLLPFFLNSALCLHFLQGIGRRRICLVLLCLDVAAEEICACLFSLYGSVLRGYPGNGLAEGDWGTYSRNGLPGERFRQYLENGTLDGICMAASAAALIFFLLSAYRFCRKKYYVSAVSR